MNQIDFGVFHWLNFFAGINHWMDELIIFKSEYLGWSIIAILIFIFLFEIKDKDKFKINWRIGCLALASGILSRFIFGEAIRFFWNRPRPFDVLQNIHQLVLHESGGAFPSGHASFFFAVAMSTFLYRKKLGLLFFIIAIVMSIGRVEAGLHWPSDILAGAAIGILSAWIIHTLSKKFWKQKTT